MPLNITIQGDRAGTGTGGQRPNVVGDWREGEQTATRWFNKAAFAMPDPGALGNLGRNVVIGPGMNNWDVSMQKFFAFSEQTKLEFRAEMFNAPHHFPYWSVATTMGATNFGQVTNATDPRTFQFALKLLF
jgi:hypothetical protein